MYLNGKDLSTLISLKDLNAQGVTEEQLRKVAEASAAEGEMIYNMPFKVIADKLEKYFRA